MKKLIILMAVVALAVAFGFAGTANAGEPLFCVPPPDGLVSWWPGDGNANDIVDGNHGSLENEAMFDAGKVGQAFSFDGLNDAVRFGDVLDDVFAGADKKFTIDFWVWINKLPSGLPGETVRADLVSKLGDSVVGPGNERQFAVILRPEGSLDFAYYCSLDVAFNLRIVRTQETLSCDTWYYIAVAYDGSVDTADGLDRVKIYLNGEPLTTFLSYSSPNFGDIPDGPANLAVGGSVASNLDVGYSLDGLIDEVEIFDRALSQSEIKAIYNAGSAGKCKPVDHYLGYKVKTTDKFVPWRVILTDQFETGDFEVKKPYRLYNPANKNGEGINDEETHLVGYKIKLVGNLGPNPECAPCKGGLTSLMLRNDGPGASILVTAGKKNEELFDEFVVSEDTFSFNGTGKDGKLGTSITITVNGEETKIHTSCSQPIGVGQTFGDGDFTFTVVSGERKDGGPICPVIKVVDQFHPEGLIVSTKKADLLLVPSAKDLEFPVEAPDPTIDHFKCYKVKTIKGAFPEDLQVHVVDQFDQAKVYDVKKPSRLCVPVDKNYEGINNPDKHLMCYKVKPAKDEPKHVKVLGINTDNQFGPLILDTDKEEELCVPCQKTVLAP